MNEQNKTVKKSFMGSFAFAFKSKTWVKVVSAVVLAAIVGLVVFLVIPKDLGRLGNDGKKTDEELIEERIESFLTAYSNGDMEAIAENLDEKTGNTLNALLDIMGGLAGGFTGFDLDLRDLFTLSIAILEVDLTSFEVTDIEISGKNAIATTEMEIYPGENAALYFEMVYENNGWYIRNMTDVKPDGFGDNSDNGGNSGGGSLPDSSDIDESFLTERTESVGLEFEMNDDNDGYRVEYMGSCTDEHVVIPEYPVDYNDIPVDTVNLSELNGATYVTIPASVKCIIGGSGNIKAINYLGTLEDWCNIEFKQGWGSYAVENTVLYINGAKIYGRLTIPSSVEKVSAYAFCGYDYISSVTVSSSIIGAHAFYRCENLENAYLQNGVRIIEDVAFCGCSKIENVSFADSVEQIGVEAFCDCVALESIRLGDNVKLIGESAFRNCTALSDINLGDSNVHVGEYAFSDTAYVNDSSNWYKGILYIDDYVYDAKDDVVNVTIKDGAIGILARAFSRKSHIESVVLPDSLKYIGEYAFEFCGSLNEITFGTAITSISDYAFYYCDEVVSVKITDTLDGIKYFGQGNESIRELKAYNLASGEYEWWVTSKLEFDGHSYLVIWGADDWDSARAVCEEMGGYLATLTSKEENDALYSYIRNYDIDEAYFGLTNEGEDGNWRWITGETFSYSNWVDGSPFMSSTRHYVKFYGYETNAWNNEHGDMHSNYEGYTPFICEWDD